MPVDLLLKGNKLYPYISLEVIGPWTHFQETKQLWLKVNRWYPSFLKQGMAWFHALWIIFFMLYFLNLRHLIHCQSLLRIPSFFVGLVGKYCSRGRTLSANLAHSPLLNEAQENKYDFWKIDIRECSSGKVRASSLIDWLNIKWCWTLEAKDTLRHPFHIIVTASGGNDGTVLLHRS